MPLIKSSSPGALKANISTLMGEVGKSPHVQSRKQALAIAFSNQRRARRENGGEVDPVLLAGGKDSKALRKRPPNPDKYQHGGRVGMEDGGGLFGAMDRMQATRNVAQGIGHSASERLADQFAQELGHHSEPPKDEDYEARLQAAVQTAMQMQARAAASRHGFQHGGVPLSHPMMNRILSRELASGLAPTAAMSSSRFPRMGYPAGGAGMQEGGPVDDESTDMPLRPSLALPHIAEPPPAHQTSVDMENPFDRAAFRMRRSVERAPDTPEGLERVQNLALTAGMLSPIGRVATLPFTALQAGIRYAPRVAAGLGGLYGLLSGTDPVSEAEARDQRSPAERKQEMALEALRLEAAQKAKLAEIEANARAKRELEEQAARLKKEADERQRLAQIAAEERFAEQEAKKKAEFAKAGFRERYPAVADTMTKLGMAGAAIIPYGNRLVKAAERALLNRRWGVVADKAEQALLAGDKNTARLYAEQLRGFQDRSNALKSGVGPVAWGASALSPLEVSMLPEQLDLISGSPEAKEKATSQLLDWHRFPAALLQGATFATLGSKAPIPFLNVPSASARGAGAIIRATPKTKKKPEPAMALGGALPFYERQGMYALAKEGMMASTSPGRGDKIPTTVKSGSYVIPADVVSGKGQGNSLAGASKFGKMFSQAPMGGAGGAAMRQGPMGTAIPAVKKITKPMFSGARMPKLRARAAGGPIGHPTPVALSGGEYVVSPEAAARYGKGNIHRGHDRLDRLVHNIRKKTIHQMRKLPGPKKK